VIEILIRVFVALVAIAFSIWIYRIIGRFKPSKLDDQSGVIRPELWSAWITVIAGSLFFSFCLFSFAFQDGGTGILLGAAMGAAIAGFMAPSVTLVHAVSWNVHGMCGPSKLFGLTLGRARTEIQWNDIVSSGSTATGYWFIASSDGRRIYWSYLYKGHQSLAQALKKNCPFVDLPTDN